MELVIASRNLHKIREYREMLKKFSNVDLLSLLDFPDYEPQEEIGKTFEEIAEQKALHAAQKLNRYVLADDSGLVVPALGDEPGIHSRRYAGKDATDRENRKKLIKKLDSIKDEERIAYYVCAVSLSSPSGIKKTVSGMCEGRLITNERGRHGFGYDPLFLKYDYNKTFGELDEETKNRISHRRKALDKMLPTLETILTSSCTTS